MKKIIIGLCSAMLLVHLGTNTGVLKQEFKTWAKKKYTKWTEKKPTGPFAQVELDLRTMRDTLSERNLLHNKSELANFLQPERDRILYLTPDINAIRNKIFGMSQVAHNPNTIPEPLLHLYKAMLIQLVHLYKLSPEYDKDSSYQDISIALGQTMGTINRLPHPLKKAGR